MSKCPSSAACTGTQCTPVASMPTCVTPNSVPGGAGQSTMRGFHNRQGEYSTSMQSASKSTTAVTFVPGGARAGRPIYDHPDPVPVIVKTVECLWRRHGLSLARCSEMGTFKRAPVRWFASYEHYPISSDNKPIELTRLVSELLNVAGGAPPCFSRCPSEFMDDTEANVGKLLSAVSLCSRLECQRCTPLCKTVDDNVRAR